MPSVLDTYAYKKGFMDGYHAGLAEGLANTCPGSDPQTLRSRPLVFLELSARSWSCLTAAGCKTIGDVADLPAEELLKLRNLGPSTATNIARALEKAGITQTAWDPFLIGK